MSNINISLEFGTDPEIVTLRMSGRSKPIVCGMLGIDTDSDNKPIRIYLRNKVHSSSEKVSYSGWIPEGVISTILTREV